MGTPNRTVTITLGGTELHLRFEALELMELKRLTGKSVSQFISELQPAPGESKTDAIMRTADLWSVVPVIQAGLASDDHYAKLSQRELTRRICALFDKEAELTRQSILAVAGLAAAEVWPAFTTACLPPGVSIDDAKKQMEADKGPLAEPPGETNSPGTDSWSSPPVAESSPANSTA